MKSQKKATRPPVKKASGAKGMGESGLPVHGSAADHIELPDGSKVSAGHACLNNLALPFCTDTDCSLLGCKHTCSTAAHLVRLLAGAGGHPSWYGPCSGITGDRLPQGQPRGSQALTQHRT